MVILVILTVLILTTNDLTAMYNYNYKNPVYMLGTVASLVLWLTIGVIAIADNTVWWYLATSLFTGVYTRCHADIRYYAGDTPIKPYYQ